MARKPAALYVVLVGTLLAAVGSLLPWVTALGGMIKVNGTNGDGVVTFLLSAVAAVLVLFGFGGVVRAGSAAAWAGLLGMIILAIAGYDAINLERTISAQGPAGISLNAKIGSGLIITLVGGIVLTLGGASAAFGSGGPRRRRYARHESVDARATESNDSA